MLCHALNMFARSAALASHWSVVEVEAERSEYIVVHRHSRRTEAGEVEHWLRVWLESVLVVEGSSTSQDRGQDVVWEA